MNLLNSASPRHFLTVVFVTVFGLSRSGRVGSRWGVRSPGDLAATYSFSAVERAQGHLLGRPPTGAFPPCGTSPLATDGTVGGSAPPLVGSIGAGGEQVVGRCGLCRPMARTVEERQLGVTRGTPLWTQITVSL